MPIPRKKLPAAFYETPNGNQPVRRWLKKLGSDDCKIVGGDIADVEYGWPLVLTFIIRCHVRRPSKVIRSGAGRDVMPGHHERRATQPGALEGRPPGRFSRSLGASKILADCEASPAHLLLPRKREMRSYVTRNYEREY